MNINEKPIFKKKTISEKPNFETLFSIISAKSFKPIHPYFKNHYPNQNRSAVFEGLLCAFPFIYKYIRWTTGEINHYPVRQQGRFENHPLGPVLGHVADIRPGSCGHFCSLIEIRAQRADQRWSFIRAVELKSCPLITIAAASALFVVCRSRLD